MSKYPINKEFGIYHKFTPPFYKAIFPLANGILNNCKKTLKSSSDLNIIQEQIKSDDGETITIYIYEPLKLKTDKILLYIHGGAFVFKGYNSHYNICKRYALDGHCKVVYVNYRLAPKYRYPIPLNDCFLVYQWMIENAERLKIDHHKIIVGGDSAGGCLAADITFKCLEKNIVKPCYQMLIYPVLDKRMITESMKQYIDTPMWNAKLNHKMWTYYLGNQPYISPNERTDFSNMPPTYIETAEYDCLHDEGVIFATKLIKEGIDVTLFETKQTMHGFDMKKCSITEKAILNRIKILKSI